MIQNLSKCLNPFKYQNFFHKLNISQIHKCAIITFALFDYCQSQKVLLCSYQCYLSKISSMAPMNFSHHVHFFCLGLLQFFDYARNSFSLVCHGLHDFSGFVFCRGLWGLPSLSRALALLFTVCRQEQEKECLMKILLGLLCLSSRYRCPSGFEPF